MEKYKYLVIGNGIAGLTAVKEIRKNDKEGSIAIISKEPYYTYFRVKLTELLCKGDFCKEDILVNKESWYEDNKVKVYLNSVAKDLDTDKSLLVLGDGTEIEYEKLLISTGSKPFIPPMKGTEKDGFFALRSLRDLNYIRDYLKDCREVAVIGGGLLGLEAAWSLRELGKKVTVLQHSDYILGNQLDEELAKRLEGELEAEGITVLTCANVEEVLGDGRVEGLRFQDGRTIDIDSVLVSTGVQPNIDLVKDTKLATNRGILVNEKLETSIENIYAAGDVIELNGVTLGLWTAGLEQGRIVGSNMTGASKEYDVPKAFASLNIGSISLFSAGKISDVDRVYEHKDGDNHSKIFVKDGVLVGSILYGDTKAMGKFRKAVFANKKIEEFLEENDLVEDYK